MHFFAHSASPDMPGLPAQAVSSTKPLNSAAMALAVKLKVKSAIAMSFFIFLSSKCWGLTSQATIAQLGTKVVIELSELCAFVICMADRGTAVEDKTGALPLALLRGHVFEILQNAALKVVDFSEPFLKHKGRGL